MAEGGGGGGIPCTEGGGQGTKYTYAQLEGLWINAGGSRSYAPVMAAIAMAESGGCSSALNSIGACGLWQIHPRQAGCLDAQTNATQAVGKFKDQGLDAWTTYTSGKYKQYLKGSVPPDLNTSGYGSSGGSKADCLVALPKVDLGVGSLGGGCAVSKSEGRAVLGAGIMVAGAAILTVGVAVLAAYGLKSSGAGKAAGSALEAAGAVVALAGAPEAGTPIAAAGHATRRASQKKQPVTRSQPRAAAAPRSQAAVTQAA